MRNAMLVILSTVAATLASCGSTGGACSDTVTLTLNDETYTATCWVIATSGGLDGENLHSTSGSASVLIEFKNAPGNGCTFTVGQTVQLDDSCVSISANSALDGGTFTAVGGSGSFTINDWSETGTLPISVTFAAGSTLTSGSGTVSISGTATGG